MNKKNVFTALLGLLLVGKMQSQTKYFSFEESESFVLGPLDGQKDWTNWGYVFTNYSLISSGIATAGVNAAVVKPNEEFEEYWGGIFQPLTTYTRMLISADVYLDDRQAADYDMMTLYSDDLKRDQRLAGFYFSYDGGLDVGTDDDFTTISNWTPKKWYSLKLVLDLNKKTIDHYIDGVKKKSVAIDEGITTIREVDFEFDNYKSGFRVDNVVIQNLDNLSTQDVAIASVKVFPNPVSDVLVVTSNEVIGAMDVMDASGKRVLVKREGDKLSVGALSKGVYYLRLSLQNGQVINRSFIKN